ncbi:MAG: RES family NAD+ phosphorylase [Rhizobiales bacterium]|nr:RES family NAD+ phosphorylase [Hyphomicrobiales bacterium]
MWTPSVAADEFAAIDVNQTFFTLIPSRFPTVDVFVRVASDCSRELAEIESLTNPRLRERDRLLNGAQVVDGNSPLLQNWNHAPFIYENPEGSRFFDPKQPVLELASDMQTALAISIRKREAFLSRTGEAAIGLEMRELSRVVRGRFADGRDWKPDLNPEERLRRGQAIMKAGFDGLLYRPMERPAGFCICAFRGKVLERALQRDHFKFVWDGSRISKIYSFGSGAEYHPDDLRGVAQILAA